MKHIHNLFSVPERARTLAIELAHLASLIIQKRFDSSLTVEWKSDGSPVTAADIEVNRIVMDRIFKEFPNHGFIGEELGKSRGNEYTWLCDPIDGTRPFSLGFPVSTFSLALTYQGVPIFAVLSYPARGWLFVAELGQGATLNGSQIQVSDAANISGEVIDVLCPSRLGYHVPGLFDAIDQKGGVPICYNSTAITAAFIARGVLAGSVWSGATPWDAAAVKLIVEEAGGKFTDLFGNDQLYDRPVKGFIASNGHVHNQLVSIVEECGIHDGKRR